MGTLNYSLAPLIPVRKISPMLLLKPRRYSRLPSNLRDCIDNPSPNTVACRPFFVLFLILTLVFYWYRIEGLELYHISTIGQMLLNSTYEYTVTQTNGSDKTMEMVADVTKEISMEFKTTRNKTGHKRQEGGFFNSVRGHSSGSNHNSTEIFDDATEDTGLDNITIANKTEILPRGLPVCEINAAYKKAGNVTINYNVTREAAFVTNPRIAMGGYYKPSKCQTRHKIAILVPYRHREENLAIFLTNIHKFLMNQQIEYRIYIIEQSGTEKFNKGRVLNAGFDQIKDYWECFIFHDVDLLPLDHRILYTCPSYPRYMSTKVYEDGKIVKLTQFFGGVTAMTDQHFLAVNGYSNRFWGWGGEDNDMYWRIRKAKLPIMKYNRDIARFIMLPHIAPEKNPKRYDILNKYSKSRAQFIEDGISTLRYTVVFKKLYSLFTHIVVDVNPYKDRVN